MNQHQQEKENLIVKVKCMLTESELQKMNHFMGKDFNPADIQYDASRKDSCIDLVSCGYSWNNGVLCVRTGVAIQPPEGYDIRAYPRSSVYKSGYILANSVGIIDESYTGEIKAMFYPVTDKAKHNLTPEFAYQGARFLQIEIRKKDPQPTFVQVDNLEKRGNRGESGFGSTGR